MQVRLGFWALVPTWSTPSAPHERAGQEAKSHISPICNYVSSRERDVCMYRGRCLRVPHMYAVAWRDGGFEGFRDRKSTRLNSSHVASSYAVFCLRKNMS